MMSMGAAHYSITWHADRLELEYDLNDILSFMAHYSKPDHGSCQGQDFADWLQGNYAL